MYLRLRPQTGRLIKKGIYMDIIKELEELYEKAKKDPEIRLSMEILRQIADEQARDLAEANRPVD